MFNHYAVAPDTSGGTRHFSLAKYLNQLGHHVTIVASSFDHATRKDLYLTPESNHRFMTIDSVPFLWIRTSTYTGNTLARLLNMLSFAHRITKLPQLKNLPPPDLIW